MVLKLQADTCGSAERPVQSGHRRTATMQLPLVSSSNGFTLIELIVVTAIIGVLAMMAIPFYSKYVTSTKNAACIGDIRTLDTAISAYNADNGGLPPSATVLADIGYPNILDPWKQPYGYNNLSEGIENPLTDISTIKDLNTDYDLYSKGANALSSTVFDVTIDADDIVRSNDGSFVGLRP